MAKNLAGACREVRRALAQSPAGPFLSLAPGREDGIWAPRPPFSQVGWGTGIQTYTLESPRGIPFWGVNLNKNGGVYLPSEPTLVVQPWLRDRWGWEPRPRPCGTLSSSAWPAQQPPSRRSPPAFPLHFPDCRESVLCRKWRNNRKVWRKLNGKWLLWSESLTF